MQMQRTTWHNLAVLAVLASCGLGVFAGAAADKQEAPIPLPPQIIKAWTDAGIIKNVTKITAFMNNARRWHGKSYSDFLRAEPVPD